MEWYYILGIISYGIFILQFIISQVGGDLDLDVDFDGETDFDVSGLLSFKGLIHFCMGLSGWLMLQGKVTTITVAVGIFIGLLFMVGLYFLYKFCMRLHSEPTKKVGVELVGAGVTVYAVLKDAYSCMVVNGGVAEEIICKSKESLKPGQNRTILSYEDGYYNI